MTLANTISPECIASGLTPFGIRLAGSTLVAIQKYINILLLWNQKVSLTSIEDPLEIVSRHFGESIFAAKILGSEICRLADVGSGAGFPGLPLKIAIPQLNVVLIEPNLKKCAFLAEVISVIELENVQIFRSQYSAFHEGRVFKNANDSAGFDVICSRALGDHKRLLKWAKDELRPDGRIMLWLGDEDAILLSRIKGWFWDPPIRLPESSRRVILTGNPVKL